MLTYPQINPVALQIGPLPVHWYGLMYLIAFAVCWGLLILRRRTSSQGFTVDQLSDLVFYAALGVIIGGRLGYMFFYDFQEVIHNPLRIFEIWKGGMSFHGGLIGVMIAIWSYGRKIGKTFLEIGDYISPVIPLGLGIGRIGNFINGELWGKVTDMPWGMVFPNAGELPRHPSQLYEVFFEGMVMFLILWFFARKPRPRGAVSGLFLICYGGFRIFIEFFREPDFQVGYLAFGWVTEGQLLSVPMIIFGILLMSCAYHRKQQPCGNI